MSAAPQPLEQILCWLSEQRAVPLRRFKDGCATMGLNWRPAAETLQRLGHVEQVGDKLAVVPPTVIWTSTPGDQAGFAFGARTGGLRDQLGEAGVVLETITVARDQPLVWRVMGSRSETADRLKELPIRFGVDRFDDVLAALPTVGNVVKGLPPREASVFERQWLHFRPFQEELAVPGTEVLHLTGVFRSAEPPREYIHRGSDGVIRAIRSREVARVARWASIAVSPKECCLQYDASRGTLRVPRVGARLPMLLDRALRVRTAVSPTLGADHRAWVYRQIPHRRARLLAKVLGLRLRPERAA